VAGYLTPTSSNDLEIQTTHVWQLRYDASRTGHPFGSGKAAMDQHICSISVCCFALTIVPAQTAAAQTFSVLQNFTGGADGANPWAGLTLDREELVRNCGFAGIHGSGTIFRLNQIKAWLTVDAIAQ
jgi:hypothetical protein